ncbi:hypothetical protein [Photobacterium sanguinicancri]|uniref:hypothetical protein n=1 Tax=Photobacterium sanguinicancri TaxID=875932 RepID=UPI0007899B51|nr:hypothetical protein [Photobacterium sanguinicancri]KXI23330.1 hypothetical protein AS132_08285 [Photobacterium sanguinicancri]
MCYSLEQTADLELINQDDETIVVDNFQEIGEHKVISKPSFKEDDEIRVVTLEAMPTVKQ